MLLTLNSLANAFLVEEIFSRTEHVTLQKIYGLEEFSSTLEFLTMLALSSGRLHKVTFFSHVSNSVDIPRARVAHLMFSLQRDTC